MAERMIIKLGDPALRRECKLVSEITPRILQLLDDMADTLYADPNGAALAAPQVGVLRRMVVVKNDGGVIELINPEIIERSGEEFGPEGCLSLPGIWGRVKRSTYVKVKALNRAGEEIILAGRDFMARCFQHEIDHLEGVLFIDHADPGQVFKEITNEPVDVLNLIKISRPNGCLRP